jgi:multiple sugar transport system substrate-binding protein
MINSPKKTKKVLSGSLIIFFLLLVSGCGLKTTTPTYKVNLEIWGPVDDVDAYQEIINNYRKANPNVGTITYKKQRIDTYQNDLIEAMASGQGPDIFLIHNDWLGSFSDKITPAPKNILNEQTFRNNFVDVCANDFISKGDIFAVPLTVNSLALYYNKDLFNAAGIVAPPTTWDEFSADAQKLTKVNSFGEIVQSGAAMGTAYNINRSTDVLNMLMLQNGTTMSTDSRGNTNFSFDSKSINALNFYTQFAKSGSENYTWNPTLHYSIDAFSEGTLAMMLNYSWQIDTIKSKSPKLNFAIAPLPQLSTANTTNFANYWAFSVAKNKTAQTANIGKTTPVSNDLRIKEAWKFLAYLTTKGNPTQAKTSGQASSPGKQYDPNFDPANNYLKKTNQPSARRDLIEKQKSDVSLGAFAQGNLIAKDFLVSDPAYMETTFAEMIDSVNKGLIGTSDALSKAINKINHSGQ